MKNNKKHEATDLKATKLLLVEQTTVVCRNSSTGEVKEVENEKDAKAFYKRGYNHCGGCGHRYYDMISASPKSVGKCHWCLEEEE